MLCLLSFFFYNQMRQYYPLCFFLSFVSKLEWLYYLYTFWLSLNIIKNIKIVKHEPKNRNRTYTLIYPDLRDVSSFHISFTTFIFFFLVSLLKKNYSCKYILTLQFIYLHFHFRSNHYFKTSENYSCIDTYA